ncbi:MAG: rhodanese-like domain-containing protein [Myxococcaceae bacterium]|nr:rhodanese-like domain-containing protein [Myxococcaceae bacterium]
MKRFEPLLYGAVMAVLLVALIAEGRRSAALDGKLALNAKELYGLLSNPQVKLQLVDLRAYDDDNYLDAHVPGSVPMPDCSIENAPPAARDRIYPYVQTVLIAGDGQEAAVERCRGQFMNARVLAGGMTAWSDALLPEDVGDYSPPKNSAGGGCL